MKIKNLIYLLVLFIFWNCNTYKKNIIAKGDQNVMVQNAITDFLNTSNLANKDSVFHITVDSINRTVSGVSIMGVTNKFQVFPKNKINSKDDWFPSRYVEKNGKLFIWADSTYGLKENIIKVMSDYKVLDTINPNSLEDLARSMEFSTDDSKKAQHYYFCKNDLTQYKKLKTSVAIGWYKIPNLPRCN